VNVRHMLSESRKRSQINTEFNWDTYDQGCRVLRSSGATSAWS